MMKTIGIIAVGLILSCYTQAQSLETVVKAWLDDAPNGFHNAFDQYGRDCGGHCVDIDAMNVDSFGTLYQTYFELKPNGSLVETFHAIKSDMENWTLLQGWESSVSVFTDHNITYQTKQANGEKWIVRLRIGKNYDASKSEILSLQVLRMGLKSPRVATPDKETKPLPGLTSIVNLKSRLADEKGKIALEALIAAADTDFEDIILEDTLKNNFYQIKEGYLNPQATKPFITVKDEPQKRTLSLRFQIDEPRNYFIFAELFYDPYGYDTVFPKAEWDIDNSDMWKAVHKEKPFLVVKKAYENGMDVIEISAVKKEYRKYLAANPDLINNDCIQGDCVNGFGVIKYAVDNKLYRYEGGFKDGKFHGIGYIYREKAEGAFTFLDLERNRESDELLLYIGHYKDGKRHGQGLSFAYAEYKDPVRSFREPSEYFQADEQTGVFNYIFQNYENDTLTAEELRSFTYHKPTEDTYMSIEQPFTTAYGEYVSGDCQDGYGVLKIQNLGNYEGQFVNGRANGKGILKMPSGEWKIFEAYHGIPKYIRTIKLPEGVSRVAAAERNVWLLAEHDCIEGDCYNGEGVKLRISADRFRRYNVTHRGYVRTTFKDGVAEGEFRIKSTEGSGVIVDGVFRNGVIDGTVNVQYPNEQTPRNEYYESGRRVTKDGQDYGEYLLEQRELWQEDYERKLREAREEGLAKAKRMREEAEALRKRKARATTSRSRSHYCHSCEGTGSYWNETVTQDTTITYDYTYSSGKYYQTYTDTRDVVSGSYITCPVCGGRGSY